MVDYPCYEPEPVQLNSLDCGEKFVFPGNPCVVYVVCAGQTEFGRRSFTDEQSFYSDYADVLVYRVISPQQLKQEPTAMKRILPVVSPSQVFNLLVKLNACWVATDSYAAAFRVKELFDNTEGLLNLLDLHRLMDCGRLTRDDAVWFMQNGGAKFLVPNGLDSDAVFDSTNKRIMEWLNPPKKTEFAWGELKPGDMVHNSTSNVNYIVVETSMYLTRIMTAEAKRDDRVLVLNLGDGRITWACREDIVPPSHKLTRTSNPDLKHLVTAE